MIVADDHFMQGSNEEMNINCVWRKVKKNQSNEKIALLFIYLVETFLMQLEQIEMGTNHPKDNLFIFQEYKYSKQLFLDDKFSKSKRIFARTSFYSFIEKMYKIFSCKS